jgi:hypothetical protein
MLGPDGFLRPGRHLVTIEEFKQHFVESFDGSTARGRLFTRWVRHREALISVIPIMSQWVNGSYVTSKIDPGDIDVVSLIDGPTYDGLAPGLQSMAGALLAGRGTQAHWGIDSYAVPVYPEGHSLHKATLKAYAYWDNQWQRVKGDIQGTKGYLEVTV